MGYRSDVVLAVAFETPEQMDEVLAVYAMDPLVQKHNTMKEWIIQRDPSPIVAYLAEGVKWYSRFEDVQAVSCIDQVAGQFASKRGFNYGLYYLRCGEDLNDVEETHGGNSMDLAYALSDLVTFHRSIAMDI